MFSSHGAWEEEKIPNGPFILDPMFSALALGISNFQDSQTASAESSLKVTG